MYITLATTDSHRNMHSKAQELQILNLSEYLAMRTGGSPYYAVRQGVPDLGHIHAHLNITEKHIEKWLDHMEEAFHDCRHDFREADVQPILDFLRFQAFFIITYRKRRDEFIARSSNF